MDVARRANLDAGHGDAMSRISRLILWVLGFVVVAIAILALLPSLLGSLLFALLVFALFDLSSRRYRSGVRTLNSSLRAVSDQQGAIEKVARAFSKGGPLRSRCYEYARRLIAGEDAIGAALASGVPLQLSTAVALSTAPASPVSTDVGSREVGDNDSPPIDPLRELAMMETTSMPAYGQFLYLGVTAMVTCLVMAFMATSIVPTMEQMFEEFGLSMPLQWVFEMGPVVWVFVLLGAIGVILVPILNRARKLGVRLPSWVPMTPRMAERRAEVLFGLADGLDAGWPLGRTMALGHRIAQTGWERRALERAMRDVQQGIEPIESIHRIGWLDSTEAAWLAGANPARAGELLRGFAAQSVRDAHENTRWIMAWLFPIVVVLLGVSVLLFALAFFGSLAVLIRGLS
jgi:hypothetical protein